MSWIRRFIHPCHLSFRPLGFRTFASSSPSGIIQPTIQHFGMSEEVAVLTISLFVLGKYGIYKVLSSSNLKLITGYTVGPILWGPLSEQVCHDVLILFHFLTPMPPVWSQVGLHVLNQPWKQNLVFLRPIFIIAFVVYTAFQVGCALAPNAASILIFRFLGGTFAARCARCTAG